MTWNINYCNRFADQRQGAWTTCAGGGYTHRTSSVSSFVLFTTRSRNGVGVSPCRVRARP